MNIDRLVSKIACGDIQPHDYSDWAESLLNQGVESENILMLASFGLEKNIDRYEIETYFEKCLSELKIQLPDNNESLKIYAKLCCIEILKENTLPATAVNNLSRLASLTKHEEPLFRIWDELSEDIYFIENEEHGAIWNSGLTIDNQTTYVKEFAEQFLQLLELQLPVNFWQLSYCKNCKNICESIIKIEEKQKLVTKIDFFESSIEQSGNYAVCAQCFTPYPIPMSNFIARKAYIEKLKKID